MKEMKKCIMVGYEEEKLLALRMYAEQKGVSLEEELVQTVDGLYQRRMSGFRRCMTCGIPSGRMCCAPIPTPSRNGFLWNGTRNSRRSATL